MMRERPCLRQAPRLWRETEKDTAELHIIQNYFRASDRNVGALKSNMIYKALCLPLQPYLKTLSYLLFTFFIFISYLLFQITKHSTNSGPSHLLQPLPETFFPQLSRNLPHLRPVA